MTTLATKRKHRPGSLRTPRTARTVLLRMAADQERAERIRELKSQRPDLTWKRIGEAVGVTERSAINWQTTGGIDYEHAGKLAELFAVDLDWLWRGPREEDTPDLMDVVAREETLAQVIDRFGRRVDDVEAQLERIETNVTKRAEHDKRVEDMLTALAGDLATQTALLKAIKALAGNLGVTETVTMEDVIAEARETLALDVPPKPAPSRPSRGTRSKS